MPKLRRSESSKRRERSCRAKQNRWLPSGSRTPRRSRQGGVFRPLWVHDRCVAALGGGTAGSCPHASGRLNVQNPVWNQIPNRGTSRLLGGSLSVDSDRLDHRQRSRQTKASHSPSLIVDYPHDSRADNGTGQLSTVPSPFVPIPAHSWLKILHPSLKAHAFKWNHE